MTSKTDEKALEACIESTLVGKSREELKAENPEGEVKEAAIIYAETNNSGYIHSFSNDFDKEYTLDRRLFWKFLRATQPEELEKLQGEPEWETALMQRLTRQVKRHGILKILKNGLKHGDSSLTLFYTPPTHDLNANANVNWEKNIFSITRQLYYSTSNPKLSLDMVVFLNGLPILTIELKNPWTGQTVFHAQRQYKTDRDPKDPLFHQGRCVVHFALDTEQVFMTTHLNGKKTFFLPFNKGHHKGAGNPPNPNGHRTAYLWEEVLQKKSLANLLLHFAIFVKEKNENTEEEKKILYFPRYHQMEVVRKLLEQVQEDGIGKRYLVQHSAGSGKSNSMTWLVFQLIELFDNKEKKRFYDSVIVVTDRRLLNKQLRNNIKMFSQVSSILASVNHSQELREALESKKKIITTTIQKFPFIVESVSDLSSHRFAIVIDEAHSSQSGITASKLNESLGSIEVEEESSLSETIKTKMKNRKMSPNASFFAFTATPKNSTLERFGELEKEWVAGCEVLKLVEGKKQYKAFHEYTMKQAIEEGFILDVTANYTTYRSYYELQKAVETNPRFQTTKAQKKLRAFVEGHKETIQIKAEIIVQHFLKQVIIPKKLKGQAKGMVVTRGIENAILYYHALQAELKKAGVKSKVIIAFSGKKTVQEHNSDKVIVKGLEYTEDGLNGFPGKEIEEKFDTSEYRLLVVSDKYLTGFDQPKLTTMYVDKKLDGVMAVQALSRLNRCNQALGKRTEDVMILDFFNTASDIKAAFDRYYTSLVLVGGTDPNVLHDLLEALEDAEFYTKEEVEEFNERFFHNEEGYLLSPLLDLCIERFEELEEDDKADLKVKAKQFIRIYAQLTPLLSFLNVDWEKSFWFLKFLIPKMKVRQQEKDDLQDLLDSVDLSTYALQRVKLNNDLELDEEDVEVNPANPNPRGVHNPEESDFLNEIISSFNERWFSGWDATPEEQRIKFMNIAKHIFEDPIYQSQIVENQDEQNRRLALQQMIGNAVRKERTRELELYKKYASDEDFKAAFHAGIEQILLKGDVLLWKTTGEGSAAE